MNENEGLQDWGIAGTSTGSVVGDLYADRTTTPELEAHLVPEDTPLEF